MVLARHLLCCPALLASLPRMAEAPGEITGLFPRNPLICLMLRSGEYTEVTHVKAAVIEQRRYQHWKPERQPRPLADLLQR